MTEQRRIRIDITYRGTNYRGWQRQDGTPTVQGEIEAALRRLVGEPVMTRGSSRTDTGVHALDQVAAFDTTSTIPPERFAAAINANLPADIRVLHSREVSPEFDPIGDCVRKRYCYLIDDGPILSPFLRGLVWDYRFGRLDVEAMRAAAQYFPGEHDFASFQSQGSPRRSTVRTIFDISVARRPAPGLMPVVDEGNETSNVIAICVEGSGFLYHMVRTMAGTLAAVGSGKRPPDWIADVIAARTRCAAGINAPPDGLYLVGMTFRG